MVIYTQPSLVIDSHKPTVEPPTCPLYRRPLHHARSGRFPSGRRWMGSVHAYPEAVAN